MARAKAKKAKETVKKKAKTAPAKAKAAAKSKASAKASVKRASAKAPSRAAGKSATKTTSAKSAPKKASKTAKKAAAKKPVKKAAAKKATPKKAKPTARKAVKAAKSAKKASAKKTSVKKAQAKASAAKKAPSKKPAAKSAPVKSAAKKEKPVKAAASKRPPDKKKAGIAEVKAAAVRTKKKVSKRGRKRQRVTPTSTPLANWIPKDGLRPSSFLPAPPRAQSAFTVAAAPASSDRLVRDEDLAPPAPIRTIPVLVYVVQESGRIQLRTTPSVVEVAPGDAVEWDFRYSGGADVLVTQVSIEISRPSPFGKTTYRSAKPGSARPHRHVSDLVKEKALGTTTSYTIHCTNAFKTELASGTASIVVKEVEPTDAAH